MSTKIEWCDEVYNPIVGCSRTSDGCQNCYAATASAHARLQRFPQYQTVSAWDGTVEFVESQLLKPLKWRQSKKVFVCSMSDLFHSNVPDEWRDRVFAVMALCPQHVFQILTKRPENARQYFLENPWGRIADVILKEHLARFPHITPLAENLKKSTNGAYLKNCYLGTTVENQAMVNRRIPILLDIPAHVRWLSVEPLLEDVDLRLSLAPVKNSENEGTGGGIFWVVVGAESGKNRRQCEVAWIENVVSQCKQAGVSVFVKQDSHHQSGKQGRLSDEIWNTKEFPAPVLN